MTSRAELQKLIVDTVKASAPVMAMVNGIYDSVPAGSFATPKAAYISLGGHQKVRDDADCIWMAEHYIQLDIWTRTVGKIQCQRITDAVERLLSRGSFELAENALVDFRVVMSDVRQDPDGLTYHGILQLRADIEEPE